MVRHESVRTWAATLPVPPWVRTGSLVAGTLSVCAGAYVYYDVARSLRAANGHAATTVATGGDAASGGAMGGILAIATIAVPLIIWGMVAVTIGATVPGESTVPGVPDLEFSEEQRVKVVTGALLSGIGPVVFVLIGVGLAPIVPSVFGPVTALAAFAFLVGWLLVGVGFVDRLVDEFVD